MAAPEIATMAAQRRPNGLISRPFPHFGLFRAYIARFRVRGVPAAESVPGNLYSDEIRRTQGWGSRQGR